MQRRFSLSSITLLDGLAITATVVALAGVVWSPKLTNAVARATGSVKPVEVSVDVRHLQVADAEALLEAIRCLLYTSPSPRDRQKSRMPSSA